MDLSQLHKNWWQKFFYKIYRLKTKIFVFLRKKDSISYSSNDEDQILDILTGKIDKGFYIDIGANDPEHISNTKKFYQRGWTGINIEPNVECYQKLLKYRPNDINLNVGVGDGERDYFGLVEVERSMGATFSEKAAEAREIKSVPHKIVKMQLLPLRELFKTHVGNRQVDFMSIDVEEFEWEVLVSNDWSKYRPRVLCIERWGFHTYLKNFGYKFVMSDGSNSYFKLKN